MTTKLEGDVLWGCHTLVKKSLGGPKQNLRGRGRGKNSGSLRQYLHSDL